MSEDSREELRRQAWEEYMAAYQAEFGEITPEQAEEAHRQTLVH